MSANVSTAGERDLEQFKKVLEIVISGGEGLMAHAISCIAETGRGQQ